MANTAADKLAYLQATKESIRDAIVAKGVEVPSGTTFRQYADKINAIQKGREVITYYGVGNKIPNTFTNADIWTMTFYGYSNDYGYYGRKIEYDPGQGYTPNDISPSISGSYIILTTEYVSVAVIQ